MHALRRRPMYHNSFGLERISKPADDLLKMAIDIDLDLRNETKIYFEYLERLFSYTVVAA